MSSYECCNCGDLSGTVYDSLEEAQKEMREWGYIPADEYSCDGSAEYWVNTSDLPGDATSLDDLEDSAAWLDRYLSDGAFAPQIVQREE